MASKGKTPVRDAASREVRARRTQARKDKNLAANAAQHQANLAFLAEHGIAPKSATYEKTIKRTVKRGKNIEVVEHTVTKFFSPSTLRRRHARAIV